MVPPPGIAYVHIGGRRKIHLLQVGKNLHLSKSSSLVISSWMLEPLRRRSSTQGVALSTKMLEVRSAKDSRVSKETIAQHRPEPEQCPCIEYSADEAL